MQLFTERTLSAHLIARGWLPQAAKPRISIIPGGVSCKLFRVADGNRRFVVKQALEKLEVQADWRSDPSRIFAEIDCLEWAARAIDAHLVPEVLGRDDENFLYLMECAPDGSENWKEKLLRGQIECAIAEDVGDFLGRVHTLTHGDAWAKTRFADKSRFDELRLDAYLRHTARAHPDLQAGFEDEIARLGSASLSLVHGDYSPKNFLLLPDGRLWILDWEVAHYGHPAFDCAFCLNHLLIKALVLPAHRQELFEAAQMFWAAYRNRSTLVTFPHLGRLIGMLMLARVDGKSPVEYVRSEELKDLLRKTAKKHILDEADDLKRMLV